jgi:hypothetical protein
MEKLRAAFILVEVIFYEKMAKNKSQILLRALKQKCQINIPTEVSI